MPYAARQSRDPRSTPRRAQLPKRQSAPLTLIDLVQAVSESAVNEREAIATLNHMLKSGRVRFQGALRDRRARID